MSQFKKAENIRMMDMNPFQLIGNDWMLITAKDGDKMNAMTASWGGLGVLWNKNVAFVVIRNSRYTKELIDASESFSISFFDHKKYAEDLSFFGTVSGRTEDKLINSRLKLTNKDEVPYFEEAKLVLKCKKMFIQELVPGGFLDDSLMDQFYPDFDLHCLYVVEITEALVQE